MKRNKIIVPSLIILSMLFSSSFVQLASSDSNNSNQQTITTTIGSTYVTSTSTSYTTIVTTTAGGFPSLNQDLPFGSGSMNLNFVVGNNLIKDNGPTALNGQAGKTIFYDINVNSLPVDNLIKMLYPSDVGLIESLGTQNSKIFFKIITDEGDYVQFVPGFILGDNILFNTSLLFSSNSSELSALLSSLLIPNQLTFSLSTDSIFMTNPMANQTGPNCYNYYYYNYYYYFSNGYPSCPTIMPPYMNFYLSSNYNQHKQEFDKYYANYLLYANYTQMSSLNWDRYSSDFLPANVQRQSQYTYCSLLDNISNCYSSYNYYEQNLIVNNNTVNLSMPYNRISGAYYQSQFNPNVNPITSQPYPSLYINGSYSYTGNKTTKINLLNNIPDGSKIAVIFQPSYYLYAINGQVTIPSNSTTSTIDINSVAGVFNLKTFQNSLSLDQQPGTNYYTGGSFSGNIITLGTDPGPIPLIVIYRDVTQPYYFYNNVLNQNSFVTSIGFHSSLIPKIDAGYSVKYNRNDPTTNGWAKEIDIFANIDLNNNDVYSNDEKIDISLTYNASLTYQVNNPLSAGDQGVYKITTSNLDVNLSSTYNYFYNQITGSSITDLVNSIDSLTGKKLYDYTITSTDGLLAFFKGYSYNPFLPDNNPNAKTSLNLGDAFSTYDGAFYTNFTTFNNTIYNLYDFNNNNYYYSPNITNYWLKNYGTKVNATSSPDGYYILENTTLTNNYAQLSFPSGSYGSVSFYRAADYDFSKSPYDQIAISYSGYIYQNYSDGSFYLNTYNYFTGSQNVIVVYQPSSSLYAINGKLILPEPVSNINGIYSSNYYYNGSNSNLLSRTTINGSILTISNLPRFSQVYIIYLQSSWAGRNVYARINSYDIFETLNQMTSLFGFTPARGQDFFLTQNNDQVFNAIATDKFGLLLQYIESIINSNPNSGTIGNISLDGSLNFSFLTNSNQDKISMVNGSLNIFLPLIMKSNTIPLDVHMDLYLSGSIGLWTTWKASGILKEFGVSIQAQIKTMPLSQSVSSTSTTSFIKSDTTISTSDGFIFQSFLLATLVMVPLIYRRRKNLK